jgi:HPt (histidine-containing phosphotransfer) domain-containing protein
MEEQGEYCRQIESYLCRKNGGHLIRISGPKFELVCGWAQRGIPLALAQQGIDRCVERHQAKGDRRRPVQVEFCEADVLDVFDEWKRAVGVTEASGGEASGDAGEVAGAARGSLPSHLERVIARLTTLRSGSEQALDSLLDDVVRELDAAQAKAKTIRGEARDALLDRLRQLDAALTDAVRQRAGEQTLQQVAAEADEELKPFKTRMPVDAYHQSHRACIDRLLRQRAGLPTIAYE